MEDMNTASILKLIRTKDEQEELADLLEKLLEINYTDKLEVPADLLKTVVMKSILNAISQEIVSKQISGNRNEIEKFLESLLKASRNLNTIKITTAISPGRNLLKKIGDWAEKNISGNLIFDLTVDPQILGGAIIVNDKGDYSDFSISKYIDDLFLKKGGNIFFTSL